MDTYSRLPKDVLTLDRVIDRRRNRCGAEIDHSTWRYMNLTLNRVVSVDVPREQRPVVPRRRCVGVDDRCLVLVGGADGSVVWLIDVSGPVAVDSAVGGGTIAIRRTCRRIDRKRSRPALSPSSKDSLVRGQKRDCLAGVDEPSLQYSSVWDVVGVQPSEAT